jgi:hypothetical protein
MFSTALLLKLLELLNQGSMHDKQLHIKCCLKRRDQLGDIGLHVDGRVTLSVSKTKRLWSISSITENSLINWETTS